MYRLHKWEHLSSEVTNPKVQQPVSTSIVQNGFVTPKTNPCAVHCFLSNPLTPTGLVAVSILAFQCVFSHMVICIYILPWIHDLTVQPFSLSSVPFSSCTTACLEGLDCFWVWEFEAVSVVVFPLCFNSSGYQGAQLWDHVVSTNLCYKGSQPCRAHTVPSQEEEFCLPFCGFGRICHEGFLLKYTGHLFLYLPSLYLVWKCWHSGLELMTCLLYHHTELATWISLLLVFVHL